MTETNGIAVVTGGLSGSGAATAAAYGGLRASTETDRRAAQVRLSSKR